MKQSQPINASESCHRRRDGCLLLFTSIKSGAWTQETPTKPSAALLLPARRRRAVARRNRKPWEGTYREKCACDAERRLDSAGCAYGRPGLVRRICKKNALERNISVQSDHDTLNSPTPWGIRRTYIRADRGRQQSELIAVIRSKCRRRKRSANGGRP